VKGVRGAAAQENVVQHYQVLNVHGRLREVDRLFCGERYNRDFLLINSQSCELGFQFTGATGDELHSTGADSSSSWHQGIQQNENRVPPQTGVLWSAECARGGAGSCARG
jgi:hypothetical protein